MKTSSNRKGHHRFLESALLTLGHTSEPRAFDSIALQKREVLVAIPRETEEQRRQRAIANTGVANLSSVRVRIGVYLAPLYVEGEAHIGRTMGKVVFDCRPRPLLCRHKRICHI